MSGPQAMRFGPERKDFVGIEPKGECEHCGGQCSPECGKHPKGCFYGGSTNQSAYWMIANGCELYHGDHK